MSRDEALINEVLSPEDIPKISGFYLHAQNKAYFEVLSPGDKALKIMAISLAIFLSILRHLLQEIKKVKKGIISIEMVEI